jgi:hypothetical protein
MRRGLRILLWMALACSLGVVVGYFFLAPKPAKKPDAPSVVVRIREVARLEALDISLYKKISFEPDPVSGGTFWGDVFNWARYAVQPARGRAIVFADVHLEFDLAKIDESTVRIAGDRVQLVLPPVQAKVELKPGETEVIGSNLDSAQTAQLLELARVAFEQEVLADHKLRDRARASAERSLRGLILTLGFREVVFVESKQVRASG